MFRSGTPVAGCLDALVARSEDYSHFIPTLGNDFRGPELSDEIEDRLEIEGTEVVIINRVTLAPAWRGLGGAGRLTTTMR